jgi:hypothetical protein
VATTVQNIIDGIKWGTDLQAGNRLLAADLIPEIDAAYKEAWEIIVAAYEDLFVKKVDLTITGGVGLNTYASLPSDFWKVKGIQRQAGVTFGAPIPVNQFAEAGAADEPSYRLVDGTLYFEPEASSGGTYRLWYVYAPPDLTATTDVIVDRANGAVKRFIIDTVGVRVQGREEEDAGVLAGFRARLEARISKMAAHRRGGRRIADVRRPARFRFLTRSGLALP